MKIGFFGDGKWALLAVQRILRQSDYKLVFIVPRHSMPDESLKHLAKDLNIPFLVFPQINSDQALSHLCTYGADLFVSVSFDQILKSKIIKSAPKGFINCHAGELPFYRGRNVLNWVLINGEERFGITVHYVDEGIDTGDIICQRTFEITSTDDYATVVEKATEGCSAVLMEALDLINKDTVVRIRQQDIHPVGFYCSKRRDGDEWLDWHWSSERIFNFIRGITFPGPCARTRKSENELALIRAKLITGAPDYVDVPGRVVGRNSEGVIVKTGTSTIQLTLVASVQVNGALSESRIPEFPIGTQFFSMIRGD